MQIITTKDLANAKIKRNNVFLELLRLEEKIIKLDMVLKYRLLKSNSNRFSNIERINEQYYNTIFVNDSKLFNFNNSKELPIFMFYHSNKPKEFFNTTFEKTKKLSFIVSNLKGNK
jgi:hypothetical protein